MNDNISADIARVFYLFQRKITAMTALGSHSHSHIVVNDQTVQCTEIIVCVGLMPIHKCFFYQNQFDFLGNCISEQGVGPEPEEAKAIREM